MKKVLTLLTIAAICWMPWQLIQAQTSNDNCLEVLSGVFSNKETLSWDWWKGPGYSKIDSNKTEILAVNDFPDHSIELYFVNGILQSYAIYFKDKRLEEIRELYGCDPNHNSVSWLSDKGDVNAMFYVFENSLTIDINQINGNGKGNGNGNSSGTGSRRQINTDGRSMLR